MGGVAGIATQSICRGQDRDWFAAGEELEIRSCNNLLWERARLGTVQKNKDFMALGESELLSRLHILTLPAAVPRSRGT